MVNEEFWAGQRREMVRTQLQPRGIRDPRVLAAMDTVPRHDFVPADLQEHAYADGALAIGHGQTISQPYIVARMAELARLNGGERVLEIGAGCGYASAVLSLLAARVCALELEQSLSQAARLRLERLGYTNIDLRQGDGWEPWPGGGEFDAIFCACAPETLPEVLAGQLAEGGRLILPIGPRDAQQTLLCLRKDRDQELVEEAADPVRFVPMR
jgi:protein-L-isoaspartate(D-aspartate) O-methyltransferase